MSTLLVYHFVRQVLGSLRDSFPLNNQCLLCCFDPDFLHYCNINKAKVLYAEKIENLIICFAEIMDLSLNAFVQLN